MNGLEETIGTNGFSMVLCLSKIGPDGFLVWQPLVSMVLRWFLVWQPLDGFSMVANHWSNDGMVTIHRYGLHPEHDILGLGTYSLQGILISSGTFA